MRRALTLVVVVAAAGCAMKGATAPPPAAERPGASAPSSSSATAPLILPANVRALPGPWTADPRLAARAAEVAAALAAASGKMASELGVSFEPAREPLVVLDPAAPRDGDATLRFVDGVRRPVLRIPPAALLSGEFHAAHDTAPLVAEGAILAACGERAPPDWVRAGVAVVVSGEFDRRVRRAMLADADLRVAPDEIFPHGGALESAVRARALARIARVERPLARLVTLLGEGAGEDAALTAMGVARREFLDAAADTDRDRALSVVTEDPLLPALAAARRAFAAGDAGRADAYLAPRAAELAGSVGDGWLLADARLTLAEIALTRGETRSAATNLAAAKAGGKLLRLSAARVAEVAVAPPGERAALLGALAADDPKALDAPTVAALLPLPADLALRVPTLRADLTSRSAEARRRAAFQLGESATKDAAPAIRLLVGDADASVRRAAVAALALVLGNAADDEVEAATKDKDAAVRRTALDLLAVSSRARAALRAAAMKDDPDPGVRARAVELSRTK